MKLRVDGLSIFFLFFFFHFTKILTLTILDDLIFYHAHVPITASGNELLLEPRLIQTGDCPKILDGLL